MEITKKFSIDDIELFKDDEDIDFAHVKIWALAEGSNSHKNPISLEVLKRDGHTILGKLIIGKFSKFQHDTTTHLPDQTILGYIPKEQEVKFEKKDGKFFITVEGLISKLYATDIVKMFKDLNFRSVSCEFSCVEGEENENGEVPILSFCIHGVTILGLNYSPSCKGAEIKVMQFAEKENNSLQIFAEQRKNILNKERKNKEETMAEEKKKVEAEKLEKDSKEMAETKVEKEEKPTSSNKKEEEKKEMSEATKKATKEKEDKSDKKEDESEKKMSTDANVDTVASLAFLENETEQYKEMINKMYSKDKEIIMEEYLKMAKERDELKKYKEEKVEQEKEFEVDKIMAEVKEDLDSKEFDDLRKEGMECKLEEVKGFANKVKAFAYEKAKNNKKENKEDMVMRFAVETATKKEECSTADDIYNKYLK